MEAFHDLYVHTAGRDHFTPRPLPYFKTMFAELNAEDPERIKLYVAHHQGVLVAATIGVRVCCHAWYLYGRHQLRSGRCAAPTPASGR